MTPKQIIEAALAHCPTEQCVDDIVAQIMIDRLRAEGYVIVPIQPTKEMLDEAWASALAEDAAGVWRDMIESAANGQLKEG